MNIMNSFPFKPPFERPPPTPPSTPANQERISVMLYMISIYVMLF